MNIERTLKKVGGSVTVPIPGQIAVIRIEPVTERPPDDMAEFIARFTDKYDDALRTLSER